MFRPQAISRLDGLSTGGESKLTTHATNSHRRTRPDQGGKSVPVCDYQHTSFAGPFLGLVEIKNKLRIIGKKIESVRGALVLVSKTLRCCQDRTYLCARKSCCGKLKSCLGVSPRFAGLWEDLAEGGNDEGVQWAAKVEVVPALAGEHSGFGEA